MGASMSQPYQSVGFCANSAIPTSTAPMPTTTCSLVRASVIPSAVTCDMTGYLTRPALASEWSVSPSDPRPSDTCMTSCFTLDTCRSVSYDAATRQCQLFSANLKRMKPRRSRTGAVYSEPGCFAQSCETIEAASVLDSTALRDIARHSALNGTEEGHFIGSEYYCGQEATVHLTDPSMPYDEHTYFPVNLPFPLHIYGSSSTEAYVSINGYLSLSSPFMAPSHPHPLPYYTHNTGATAAELDAGIPLIQGGLPENSIAPLWIPQAVNNHAEKHAYSSYANMLGAGNAVSEMVIQAQQHAPRQRMWYTISGIAPTRSVVFEWRTSHRGDKRSLLSYSMEYHEAEPGVWRVKYHDVGDAGELAVVGAQGTQAGGVFVQAEVRGSQLGKGSEVVFDGWAGKNEVRRVRRSVRGRREL